jgi:hypothetical protein
MYLIDAILVYMKKIPNRLTSHAGEELWEGIDLTECKADDFGE